MFDKQNIHLHCLDISKRIKDFLLAKKSREFLIFLFFMFVSFSFWLLQVLNDDYETEYTVSLRMKDVPDNVVLTSELPSNMKITLKDRGTVLVNYSLGQGLMPLTLDFAEYSDKGNQVRIPSITLAKKITAQLSQSTKLVAIKPDTLEFIYTKGAAKTVPVKICGTITPERQYYVSDTIFSPDSVRVYAPKSILDTITAAYTKTIDFEEVSDTVRKRVSFASVKGARFIPDYSDLTLKVDVYAEKTVDVPVVGVNFPHDKVLRTFPSKAKVTFQIGLSRFMEVGADDFQVVVDYEDLQNEGGDKCKLQLKEIPKGVNHVRVNPNEMDYIIEQKVGLR
ncbi:MAG: YbbR-like domain-containing protein [Bacteroidaceae bacterium]|nr:YbbR-like domain-containing protein [Bacteroidaceae bacterium]